MKKQIYKQILTVMAGKVGEDRETIASLETEVDVANFNLESSRKVINTLKAQIGSFKVESMLQKQGVDSSLLIKKMLIVLAEIKYPKTPQFEPSIKISMIKVLREMTGGLGLREAKDIIDEWYSIVDNKAIIVEGDDTSTSL